jgi:hypothetical protein
MATGSGGTRTIVGAMAANTSSPTVRNGGCRTRRDRMTRAKPPPSTATSRSRYRSTPRAPAPVPGLADGQSGKRYRLAGAARPVEGRCEGGA